MNRESDDGSREGRERILAARRRAAAEEKHVAVIFGADWCPDSKAFDRALEHRLVRPIVEPSFALVPLDVGQRDRCQELMAELDLDVRRGIPSMAILDAEGEIVGALRDGELRNARGMSPLEIATLFHRWAPSSPSADSHG